MIHLSMRIPLPLVTAVLDILDGADAVTNVAVVDRAYRKPVGTLVSCDVAREGAHAVVARLRELDVHRDGSLMFLDPGTLLSEAADAAENAAPGSPDDGLVWDTVEDRVRRESAMSFAFLAFLVLATLIAGSGRLLDQPILIVGAMVVGPEFSPVAAICVALTRPRFAMLPGALRTLVGGYVVAVLVAIPFWALVHAAGYASRADVASGPLTDFIVRPDGWSFTIALFAGVAGVLALTTAKSGPLVGVFISVTTVPAAGTLALCVGTGVWSEVLPALVQLLVNLAGLVLAGTLTLLTQRYLWRRVGARSTSLHHA